MSARKYIWGIILLAVGVLLLLNNFNLMNFSIDWHVLGSMWPLILIIVGLNSLSKNTGWNPWIFSGLIAITFSILIYQVVDFSGKPMWGDGTVQSDMDEDASLNRQSFTLPVDSNVSTARLYFEGAAAKFILNDTTENLISAETQTTGAEYSLTKNLNDSVDDVRMRLNKTKFHYKNGNWDNEVRMKLNPNTHWSFDMDIGAGAVEFDLSPYAVKKMQLNAGAAAIDLKLSNKLPESTYEINAGASGITISIPKGARCRLNLDAVLSSKELEGFTSKADNIYETDDFNSSTGNIIIIDLDAGMSEVKISRY